MEASAETSLVTTTVANGVAHLRLNRPDRRNALVGPLVSNLRQALADTRAQTGAVVLSGEGEHLCAGLDLDAFNADPAPEWRPHFSENWLSLHQEIWDDQRPLVVAHTGGAVGGGSALVWAGDMVISGESAFTHVLEVAIGMVAPINLVWLMVRHGRAVATELALMAERIDGAGMFRRGLTTELVADEIVLERALAYAERMAGFPREAVTRSKEVINALSSMDFGGALATAQAMQAPDARPKRMNE
ncbi:MAG: enoyl-CoA hydratase/isomerase family protein [Acidimicrobiia bacterium]